MRHRLYFVLAAFLFLAGCKETDVTPEPSVYTPVSGHVALGNPSGATAEISDYNNFLMVKPQYVLSYSRDRGTPNWVSWHLSRDWTGSAPRQDDFRADMTLPAGWFRVGASAYTGSGFDRGHNIPSADRTRTVEDNSATFLMTNMIPQAPNHNRNTWANLEDYTRDLIDAGMEAYVIMGSYGIGGVGSSGAANTIDNGRVTVPKSIWKVIVVLPEGNDDISRINANTRVIAVDIPNVNTVNSDWGTYRTTVDAIEQATGHDLLSALPDQIENIIEARTDNGPTR
ncbi:DNA/RNA non-specific endonuclease [Pontibacter chinhatensis]|uniref:Endonuclease G n=1 Tax=Pontibacter chinhatensis TaxID=1436961 RepID=A0A1I2ZRN7_9BACT|nr:DNA/RNA non-specific endonuclease [Pontibacter chinhatensis]SFH40517.1 endonuclease G [Pontibacter chinhatensis]